MRRWLSVSQKESPYQEPNPAGAYIVDFPASKTEKINVYCYSLWCFVMVTCANTIYPRFPKLLPSILCIFFSDWFPISDHKNDASFSTDDLAITANEKIQLNIRYLT